VEPQIHHLFISKGHDFFGRHGKGREEHEITDHESIELVAGKGIVGDRFYEYEENYKGQITFFDYAVFEAVKEKFGLPDLDVSAFRRNVVVSGMDLKALVGRTFKIGELEFEGTQESKPCYWMDEACAPGVDKFLRGQGGLRCRVLKGGTLAKSASAKS